MSSTIICNNINKELNFHDVLSIFVHTFKMKFSKLKTNYMKNRAIQSKNYMHKLLEELYNDKDDYCHKIHKRERTKSKTKKNSRRNINNNANKHTYTTINNNRTSDSISNFNYSYDKENDNNHISHLNNNIFNTLSNESSAQDNINNTYSSLSKQNNKNMINHYDMIINSSKSNEDTNHCRRYPSSSLSNYDESTSCASTSSIFASSLNSVLFYNSQERYNNNNNYNKNNPEGIGNTGKRYESMNEYNYNMLHKINKRYKYWNEERIYYEKSKSFSDSIYTKESLCQKKQKKNNYINMYNEPFMNIHNSLSNDYNDIMKSTIKNDRSI